MTLTNPYRQHNYMGEYANAAAALTWIQANKWDSNGDGTGNPQAGMFYWDTTATAMKQYDGAAWVDMGITDHGGLAGLADDDHSGHPWLAGRSGGQTLRGGTDASDDLTLGSTAHGTKGDVIIEDPVDMSAKQIQNMADGDAASQDAATVSQMETAISSVSQGTFWLDDVDALASRSGLPSYTRATDVLTADANGALPTQDGVTSVLNQRYLVAEGDGTTSHIDHGVYKLTQLGDGSNPWKLTRETPLQDADPAASRVTSIDQGTTYAEEVFRCTNDDGSDVVNTDALLFKTWAQITDHGNLVGLADDDHSQYHTDARGDARYRTQSELSSTTPASEGAALVGTDSKTNLGAATTVEAALTFLEGQDPPKFSSGAGNPNAGGGTAGAVGDQYIDTTNDIPYVNVTGTNTGWMVQ